MKAVDKVRALLRNQQGLSTVEYVVLLVLIVAMSVTLWRQFGSSVSGKLQRAADDYETEVVPTP